LEIGSLHLFAPELVAQRDHGEAEILVAEAQLAQQVFCQLLEASLGERLGAVEGLAPVGGGSADAVAQLPRLGDDLEVGGAGTLVLLFGLGFDSGCHVAFLFQSLLCWMPRPKASAPALSRGRLSGAACQNATT